jgi:hypothetical protein
VFMSVVLNNLLAVELVGTFNHKANFELTM